MARNHPNASSRPINPFVYARPLEPDDVIDRTDEVSYLLQQVAGGHPVCLYAPRRFGKTSLLKKALMEADEQGVIAIYVDLSDVLSTPDLVDRLEHAYRSLRGPIARVISSTLAELGLSIEIAGVRVEADARRGGSEQATHVLHRLLDLPLKVHERTGRQCMIVFDEFQELLELEGMDGLLRSHIQHHGSAASYVFSGSEPSMLLRLFADRSRPFFGQAEQKRLGRLPAPDAVPDIETRFAATRQDPGPIIGELLAVSQGHPQRTMLLAHRLWDEVASSRARGPEALASAFETTIRQLDPELRATWDALTPNERRVLSAVAQGLSPQEKYALAKTGLRNASSAQRATQTLLDNAILERDEEGRLLIVDPLFSQWIARRRGQPATMYVFPLSRRQWVVTDGPSLAFQRSRHASKADAEAQADHYLTEQGRGGSVEIYDTDDVDDLPAWAQPYAER